MRTVVAGLLLVAAFLLATVACGWWGVPLTAAAWGIAVPQRTSAWRAALASVCAWGVLLIFDSLHAPVGELLHILSSVFRLPGPGVIVITLLFPMALAWSATEVCVTIRSRVAGP